MIKLIRPGFELIIAGIDTAYFIFLNLKFSHVLIENIMFIFLIFVIKQKYDLEE